MYCTCTVRVCIYNFNFHLYKRLDYNVYRKKYFFRFVYGSTCLFAGVKMWKIEIEAIAELNLFNFGIIVDVVAVAYIRCLRHTFANGEFLVVIDISLKLNVIAKRL